MGFRTIILSLLLLINVDSALAESINLRLNIKFNTNEAGFDERGESTLNRLYEVARTLPDVEILISGHSDSTGAEDYNLYLSLQRANTVAEYLKFKGIPAERFVTKGFGESAPLADNGTKEGRTKNRRVVASILNLTKEELAQIMQFLRRTVRKTPKIEVIEESAPVEEYKEDLKRTRRVRRKPKRYYITGFLGPNWSSAYYGEDLLVEHGELSFFSFGLDAGVRLSKKWSLDYYLYYLPTKISREDSGIDVNYENNLYGLRLGYLAKRGRNYRLSLIGGVSSHIIGGVEPSSTGVIGFSKFQHTSLALGIRHEQKITNKWVFDSDLTYLFPLSVDGLSDSSGTLWYRGVLGVKRRINHRLRLGIEYQAVYHESEFVYASGRTSTPEFFVQTLMAGLKYTF